MKSPCAGLKTALVALAVAAAGVSATPALGASANQMLRYHGYRLVVPSSWPVYRLSTSSTTCVRFDRHAVYLGRPGANQRCPAHAAGRTEAIQVAPAAQSSRSGGEAAALNGAATTVVKASGGVVVTATWGADPGLIRRALRVRSLPATATARPALRPALRTLSPLARASAASTAGGVYTGLGFDVCSTPSAATMSAWGSSQYRAVGVYLGGANLACSQPNLNSNWVVQESAAGWHLIPIYVGLQAPSNTCGCAAISPTAAASQGAAAASDAVAHAQAVGLGPGNPVYFDMEAYTVNSANTAAVLTFLASWTAQLHASGYRSGVYSSADSGIRDLAAQYGTSYTEPDDIWVARWNQAHNTIEPNVPTADWAAHQRLHQYDGGHNETHGGVTLNIDGDYLDGATAAAGAGAPPPPPVPTAPSLSVVAAPDGGIELRPSWSGIAGISSWQVLGGAAPTSLAPITIPVSAATAGPIVVRSAFAYFGVVALGSTGQTLGTSIPVATPAHVAIFGTSAFVPSRGVGGVPIGCFSASPCDVTTRVTAGRSTIATTGPEHVTVGGGLTFFKLSARGLTLLARARGHRLAVTVTVRDVSGASAARTMTLVGFTTSGRGPRRTIRQAPTLRIIGATDFVSRGRVGGVLAGCFAATPCHPITTITAGGRVIARAAQEFLGANELGYLIFSLTGAGQRMLAQAPGNQLPATVTITDGGARATAQIALVSFR